MTQPTTPFRLPRCTYPTADDSPNHGLFDLPEELSLVDFESARNYRSHTYSAIRLNGFDKSKILKLAHIIAKSFALHEPMNRHVRPPMKIPTEIINTKHRDAFGEEAFGLWNTEIILFWCIRLIMLTDPTRPKGQIEINEDLLRHSLMVTDTKSRPIGGALNITLPSKEDELRQDDVFLRAMFSYQDPILNFIHKHEHKAIKALCDAYPDFEKALNSGKVGYIAMIARSTALPTEHTFELFAASFEHFQEHEYEYMMITGTNQWTGAACEALGSTRIYFWPFRDEQRVASETMAKQSEPYSSDGYISNKDSGLMIYAVKL